MDSAKAKRLALLSAVLTALVVVAVRSGAMEAVLKIFSGHNIPVQGPPVAATHSKLSEHEREYIEGLPPQQQAEELTRAAINHDEGATAMIMEKLDSWKGQLKRTKNLDNLAATALYSNDLRVRAAMIEVDLVAYGIDKSNEWADRLIQSGEDTPGNRPFDAWTLGMLANRGIESEHIHDVLRQWLHDSDEQTRFWAVEGLAHLGTDDTIPEFLEVLRSDSSMNVRERAGCSLAKSGMMTREQRMKALPGLIEIAADPGEDSTTRSWAFQALREISNEPLGNDVEAWRNWVSQHGDERSRQFHQQDENQVLGNS
ncbi:MAG TPA: HEAT repeat domain-containing protein [Candidatus Angelobacter sp.]|nr:HEAT repeat domain-containing protein [Candidatus Angelobacter sp.]